MSSCLSLVFICRENPRLSGILQFPDRPRFCRLMKTRNRRYPRSSGMNGDKSGELGTFLFSRRVPDFCDGWRSFPTNENLNLDGRGSRLPSAMDFAHFQSPKSLGSSPPITNKHFQFPAKFVIGKIWDRFLVNTNISAKSGMVGNK